MVFWILFVIVMVAASIDKEEHHARKEYMVQIRQGWADSVKSQSEKFGLKFKKKIVSNIYLFEAEYITETNDTIEELKKTFAGKVLEIELREYSKLRFIPWLNDSPAPPGFLQWVLTSRPNPKMEKNWPYYGMDIQEAWSMGLTGQGIVVAVVDTGVELDHTDLKININRNKSLSLAEDDTDHGEAKRLPFYPETDVYTSHGTKAAGLIAAEFGNGVCSAGVAFNATLISLKVFKVNERSVLPIGITFPDDHITQALEYRRSEIDIYSCSFGLANMFSNSTNHVRTVLQEGVAQGRNGKGSIYVFSAGNLGDVYDCNTVPYSSSIYTITIASVGKGGRKPDFAMPCSSVLAATYGEYSTFNGSRKLNTTTLDGKCDQFIGTSASTAVASGIIALILQANKNLTWRDMQHIIVRSSSFERLKPHKKTRKNGIRLKYNPFFGYGIMNATAAILLARDWISVPGQVKYTVVLERSSVQHASSTMINFPRLRCPQYIEHVRVFIEYSIEASIEKNLQISLRSPAGTRSVLLSTRVNRQLDNPNIIERKWNFTSVQFWGETPYGNWTLRTRFRGLGHNFLYDSYQFRFQSVSFTFYGTATDPFTKNCHHCSEVEDKHSKCTTDEEPDKTETTNLDVHDTKTHLQVHNTYFIKAALIAAELIIIICIFSFCYLYFSGNFN